MIFLTCLIIKPIPVRFGAKQVFHPGRASEGDSAVRDFQEKHEFFVVERRTLIAKDQAVLGALYLTPGVMPTKSPPRGLLVYFQGGGSSSWGRLNALADSLQGLAIDILIFDYRGTGYSALPADASKLMSDAELWLAETRRQLPPATPVIFYGVSMGSLFSVKLAQSQQIDGLILESAITNLAQLIQGQIPWYARPFARLDLQPELAAFNNLLAWPVVVPSSLLLAGADDRLTPPEFSQAVQATFKQSSCSIMKVIPHAKHAELAEHAQAQIAIRHFISNILAKQQCGKTD